MKSEVIRFESGKGHMKHILFYSLAMALLVFALKWLQWKYLITDNSLEIYITLIALFFTALGTWIALQLVPSTQSTGANEKVSANLLQAPLPNTAELEMMNLTLREQEVLELLIMGCTNAEIADKLFLSISTVKTHVSTLFVKMEVKNRIQAVEKANRLKNQHRHQ
ncbi:MAG: response regulator transcription factor [Cytophagales bacterium]|nr:response regulator transcription factor [Cytophagales bacterium]